MNVSEELVLKGTQLQQKIVPPMVRFNTQNLCLLALYSYTDFEQPFSITNIPPFCNGESEYWDFATPGTCEIMSNIAKRVDFKFYARNEEKDIS